MDSFKARSWKISEPSVKASLPQLPDMPLPQIAMTLLSNRGIIQPEEIKEFLYPEYPRHLLDPFLFKDMKKVVERIFFAIKEKQAIVVYGDYDADGVCSASLLTTVLLALGANIAEVYMPHHEKEG